MLPKHRRGPWSSVEDAFLLELVRTQGASNWVRISQLIQSRSPKQCRERYHQNLKSSLNLDPISPEEGMLIERMVAEIGKRWAEIARRLHGRSDNAVKNWWNGGMNRRKRRDNRRADMASHQPAHSIRPMHQVAAAPHASTVRHHAAYDHMVNSTQYRYEHLPSTHRISPSAQPYPPPHHQPQPQRQVVEPPLPSPSAASHVSRTDSLTESAPPSLVSDASTSSYSPGGRYSPHHDLPSPRESRDPYGRPLLPPYPSNSNTNNNHYDPYSARDTTITVLSTQPAKEYYTHTPQSLPSFPLQVEQWKASSTPQTRHPLPPLLQLPRIQTLTAAMPMPIPRPHEPSSPPKDSRMNVNALIH